MTQLTRYRLHVANEQVNRVSAGVVVGYSVDFSCPDYELGIVSLTNSSKHDYRSYTVVKTS